MDEKNMPKFEYDAFISYRHTEPDITFAKLLMQKLERFKLPKGVESEYGITMINKVFRDREELAAAELNEAIKKALSQSRFLIVVCSPRTKDSKWIQDEINIFKQLRGTDHIITFLIEGEPEEAFPEPLQFETITVTQPDGSIIEQTNQLELLAADIRPPELRIRDKDKRAAYGESVKLDRHLRKNAKVLLKDEHLRILASMFGCKYDDLYKRHLREMIKRNITIAAAVIAGLLCFGTILLYQLNLVQKSRSSLLAYVSMSVTNEGDRINGMLTALEAYEGGGIFNRSFNVEKALYFASAKRDFGLRTRINCKDNLFRGYLYNQDNQIVAETSENKVGFYNYKNGEAQTIFDARKYKDSFIENVIPGTNNVILRINRDHDKNTSKLVIYDVKQKKELCVLKDHIDHDKSYEYLCDLDENTKSFKTDSYPLVCITMTDKESKIIDKLNIFNSQTGQYINAIEIPDIDVCKVINENLIVVVAGNNVNLYNVLSGECILSKTFDDGKIANVSAYDGKYLAVRMDNKKIRIMDIATGDILIDISDVLFFDMAVDSKTGKAAIIYSEAVNKATLKIYDLKFSRLISETKTTLYKFTGIYFEPNGKRIFVGGEDGTYDGIIVFDANTAVNLFIMRTYPQINFRITEDGTKLITFCKDNYINIYDLISAENVKETDYISDIKISPDKTVLAGKVFDSLRIIDIAGGNTLHTLNNNDSAITSYDFSSDGKRIVCCSYDGMVRSWEVETGEQINSIQLGAIASSVNYSFDCKYILTATKDSITVWDAFTGEKVKDIEGKMDYAKMHDISNGQANDVDEQYDEVKTNYFNGMISVGVNILQTKEDINAVFYKDYAAFNPDGKTIIVKRGTEVRLLSFESGKSIYDQSISPFGEVMFSPDGSKLAVCNDDSIEVCSYDGEVHYESSFYNFDKDYKNGSLIFSPNGKRAAFSTENATTYVYNFDKSKRVSTIYGVGKNTALAFQENAERIFVMSNSGILLYDINNNQFVYQTGISYNQDMKLEPFLAILPNSRLLTVETIGANTTTLKQYSQMESVDEIVQYIKTQVGSRKIDKEWYSNLLANSFH